MKRGEKSAEKEENLGEKLRRGVLLVGKRGGQRTPVRLPPWRLIRAHDEAQDSGTANDKGYPPLLISARKLAAALWELHHYRLPFAKMHHGGLRRLRHHRHEAVPDPSPSSPDLPGSASDLRKHIVASLMKHHRAIERSNHALQPVSPASYGSSMEVAPYNDAATPSSSLDFKGRIGDANYSLKTSTELIKVLNRIWTLEEQHISNMSLVKSLKKELDHARVRVKELVRDRQTDRHEIEELKNHIVESNLFRKSKEHDKMSSAIQSVRDELEDERKLRKRSESLHRKLAQELYEVKASLSKAMKEVERERKSRKLMEDLCDEFAWGIRDYEQELHALKQKYEKDWVDRAGQERLVLHISESWLDERMQMKLGQGRYGLGEETEMTSVVDKLSSELESFLQAKQSSKFTSKGNMVQKDPNIRRTSLESIPFNTPISAPQAVDDDDDSEGSDSHCFELNKPSSSGLKPHEDGHEENQTSDRLRPHTDKNHITHETVKKSNFTNSLDEVKILIEDDELKTKEGKKFEASVRKKSEICEVIEEANEEGRNDNDITNVSKTSHMIDELIRSQYHHDSNSGVSSLGNSQWRRNASPVRQWTPMLPSHEIEISESSSKLPSDLKENTLKAKLLEARTRGQRSRSRPRLKSSKISF